MVPMTFSDNGKHFLRNLESNRLKAYRDSNGKLTIGIGHLILPSETGLYQLRNWVITQSESDALFDKDCQKFVNEINATIKQQIEGARKPNQNEFDALVAFIFNIGIAAWRGSTAFRDFVNGKYPLIPAEMMRWVHDDYGNVIDGLVNRQNKQAALFKGQPLH